MESTVCNAAAIAVSCRRHCCHNDGCCVAVANLLRSVPKLLCQFGILYAVVTACF